MNILFIDTETTGLDNQKHGIIEIALEFHVNGDKISEKCIKFYDRESIVDLSALKFNKVKYSDLVNLQDSKDAMIELIDYILKLKTDRETVVCGHNVAFDLGMIKSLLSRHNIEGWDSVVSYRVLDTCTIARFLIQAGIIEAEFGSKGAGLSNVANALGVSFKDLTLHTAADDTKLCAAVYYAMLDKVRDLGPKRLGFKANVSSSNPPGETI